TAQPLDDPVVESDVGDDHAAVAAAVVRGDGLAVQRGVHSEAVVVGGDRDLAGLAVLNRLVDAAVAVLQLVGAVAEGAAQQLVAEADAEEGAPGVELAAQKRDLVGGGGGVTRTVGEEHGVGLYREEILEAGRRGHEVHAQAASEHAARRGALDAEVDGGDGREDLALGLEDDGLGDRDLLDEARTAHGGLLAHLGEQILLGGVERVAGEDAAAGGAVLAQDAG